jgi:hypothetical protein
VLAYENTVTGGNIALMKFQEGNRFLKDCLEIIPWIYKSQSLANIGRSLFTTVWEIYKERNVTAAPVQVLSQDTFYMFGDGKNVNELCFLENNGTDLDNHMKMLDENVYGVHLNSNITTAILSNNDKLMNGTMCKYILNTFCLLCNEQH